MPNPLDFVTLLCVLAAAVHLGIQGFFGFNSAEWLFGASTTIAYQVAGASAAWQLVRQRFA